jgi:hypothetical protein
MSGRKIPPKRTAQSLDDDIQAHLDSLGISHSPNLKAGLKPPKTIGGPMLVQHGSASIQPPSPEDIQHMKELEFIRKHPTTTA